MDETRSRIQDDLRGLVVGDVHFDETWRQLYSSDASIFQIEPLGVVLPRHTADVVACVRYAHENGLSIHARGAGTGLAGGVLGPGLVLDLSKHFRRVLEVGDTTVRVQAGVVVGELNETLRPRGRVFGPDPATAQVRTIGGALASTPRAVAGSNTGPRHGT
ncbi:MAG: FAD-dependent oxidoreductase [Pirellulales bacterium]